MRVFFAGAVPGVDHEWQAYSEALFVRFRVYSISFALCAFFHVDTLTRYSGTSHFAISVP